MSTMNQTPYRTVEPGIRQYRTGLFIAVITRHDKTAPGLARSYCRSGLRSIGEARAARAELERLHPKRKQGRKPGPQGRRLKGGMRKPE